MPRQLNKNLQERALLIKMLAMLIGQNSENK